MELKVAVECVSTAEGVAAAAIVYAASATPPLFSYRDSRGKTRSASLRDYNRLSAPYQVGTLSHLKKSALGWSLVTRRDGDEAAAMCLAVARALERIAHSRAATDRLHRSKVSVVLPRKTPLPADIVGDIQQELVGRRKLPWMALAAAVIAKSSRGTNA